MCGGDTPMPMEDPGALLAFLAAVFRPSAPPAFGKLSGELLPFPTLVVCTLSNPAAAVVLAAQIPHHNSCPVLHILAVMSDCEFLDERKILKSSGRRYSSSSESQAEAIGEDEDGE